MWFPFALLTGCLHSLQSIRMFMLITVSVELRKLKKETIFEIFYMGLYTVHGFSDSLLILFDGDIGFSQRPLPVPVYQKEPVARLGHPYYLMLFKILGALSHSFDYES